MMPLAAYADRLSVRPGQTIRFHAAHAGRQTVQVQLVRIISADANPKGPGIQTEPVSGNTGLKEIAAPIAQSVPHGSYGMVDSEPPVLAGPVFTLVCRVMPMLIGKQQSVVAKLDLSTQRGWGLGLDADGKLCAQVGDGNTIRTVAVGERPLAVRRWHLVWLRIDTSTHSISLGSLPYRRGKPVSGGQSVDATLPASCHIASESALLFAARHSAKPEQHFNGRLEKPMLFDRLIDPANIEAVALANSSAIADATNHWDFSEQTDSDRLIDVGKAPIHGRVVNTPGRAMAGAQWSGKNMVWHQAPVEYGAIHFHDDDIDDCHWPVCYEWAVPEGTKSSVYALMLQAGDHKENVPFHVVPPRGKANAPIAVLASTFTYTVYGNNARPEWDTDPQWQQAWRDQTAAWDAYPNNPGDHREYGLSTYNIHPDGSGISIASWHRPMLNVRIGYISFPYEEIRGSGLRHFPTDMHLVSWLEHQGHDYDIITDTELHNEGYELLKNYRVVLTGSHPEYHTGPMLDGLEQYRDNGGRFCYLGGNGFYWKVALSPTKDGVIEIRRGEGGIRAWAAEPGEYYNQFDGEYGGLWRRNGRPPQDLAGVGFTAQGNFSGSYYRKQPQIEQSRAAWIFNGVDDEIIGDHGLSAHGAAGFELDRADKNLGTPLHAIILASSENHPPEAPWILVPEEMLTHLLTWPREPASDLIRADMLFFETDGGGAVFSTGSITFCGSLPSNGFDNDVSTILDNVVRRFLDPTPFGMPTDA